MRCPFCGQELRVHDTLTHAVAWARRKRVVTVTPFWDREGFDDAEDEKSRVGRR